MTVSSGEGTASTSGAVTIRSVNGGEAGSSGVLLFSSVEKIQVERSYFMQGTPSELGARSELAGASGHVQQQKTTERIGVTRAPLSHFPNQTLLRSITPHTPFQHPFPNECFSSARLG